MGSMGSRCPEGGQSVPRRDMHISRLGLATNTRFQINDSLGFGIHLTFPVMKAKPPLVICCPLTSERLR